MTETQVQSGTASLFSLKDKVALISGATGKLGTQMSIALAEMGARVVAVARNPEPLTHLQLEINRKTDGECMAMHADMQDAQSIQAIVDQAISHFGRLDILVNNVTGNTAKRVEQLTQGEWSATLDQIVTGMFLCCQAAGQHMVKQGNGSIINIASIYGLVAPDQNIYGDSGFNSSVVYGTGKAAVLQMTKYLASYWGHQGIRVNAITPGGVLDESNNHPVFRENYHRRTPLGRMMNREEIRGPLVFLASDASSYVTGHNLVVDGGFTII